MAKKPAKKSASKKKEDESKKKPAKKSTAKKTATKKSVKKTTASKTKTATKAKKTTASKPKAPRSKKAAPRKTVKKKVSVRDLLLKKFEKLGPEKTVSLDRPRPVGTTAPALIPAEDRQEAERLRTLLLKKFDYAELIAAAEKAAKERAAAEKAAKEKAEAEKAAAKEAAEKAAKKRVAAEKAAKEKAAKEKAEAERAAAEKAAARAEAEKVTVTYATDDEGGTDTMDKTTKIVAAAVIGVLLLIAAASMSNMGNYYLKPTDKALEIWRGKFAPKGEKLFMTLPGVKAPANMKAVYSKNDVFPLIFSHYIAQADALLSQKKIPDFAAIASHLDQAAPFAVTSDLRESITARRNTLDLMVLLYRAEAAASARTKAGLEKALGYLGKAARMARSDGEKTLVAEKKAAIEKTLAAMRNTKAREAAAREKAATQKKPAPQHKTS